MVLFDREGTPNAARIRAVLCAKGLEDRVRFETIDLISAEQKTPEFLWMNPIGKTPVLRLDDGLALSECTAITEYLDNLDGRPLLTGTTPREKGLIHMMQRRVEIMVMEGVDDFFHYATPGLGAALRPWRMPDWNGAREWAERRGAFAAANFAYFAGTLDRQSYLAGEVPSMADITLWAAIDFARGAGLVLPAEARGLDRWHGDFNQIPWVRDRTGRSFHPLDIERRVAAASQPANVRQN